MLIIILHLFCTNFKPKTSIFRAQLKIVGENIQLKFARIRGAQQSKYNKDTDCHQKLATIIYHFLIMVIYLSSMLKLYYIILHCCSVKICDFQ